MIDFKIPLFLFIIYYIFFPKKKFQLIVFFQVFGNGAGNDKIYKSNDIIRFGKLSDVDGNDDFIDFNLTNLIRCSK